MHFGLTDEQAELASTLRALLAKRSDSRAVRAAVEQPRGFDEDLWKVLCTQVGVAALAIPEEYGGAGFTLVETHVVLEELGAALTPSPLLGSGVLAAQALLLAGAEDACSELLPGIASGETVAALAWTGEDGRWSVDRVAVAATPRDGGAWALDGTAAFVLDGDHADVLLVLAQATSGPALFRVHPEQSGVRRTPEVAMDQTIRLATISFDGAEVVLVDDDATRWLPTLRDVACSAVSALAVGAAVHHADALHRHLQNIGADLRHHRLDALPDGGRARDHLDAAVVQVARVAAQSERACLHSRRGAEADALHPAIHPEAGRGHAGDLLRRRRRGLRRTRRRCCPSPRRAG